MGPALTRFPSVLGAQQGTKGQEEKLCVQASLPVAVQYDALGLSQGQPGTGCWCTAAELVLFHNPEIG